MEKIEKKLYTLIKVELKREMYRFFLQEILHQTIWELLRTFARYCGDKNVTGFTELCFQLLSPCVPMNGVSKKEKNKKEEVSFKLIEIRLIEILKLLHMVEGKMKVVYLNYNCQQATDENECTVLNYQQKSFC